MAAPIEQLTSKSVELSLYRCHDPVMIEKILRRDSFDAPIPYFPRSFFRTAVKELISASSDVYFIVGEVRGQYAGFALGHTMGPTMWRKFARVYLARHPFAISWLIFRLKILLPLQRIATRLRSSTVNSNSHTSVSQTGVVRIDRAFAWSEERPDIGQVDQLFVSETYRGRGVAAMLLRYLSEEMTRKGVSLIEAHVDSTNYASLRAFLGADWQAFETTGRDYYVCYRSRNNNSDSFVHNNTPKSN